MTNSLKIIISGKVQGVFFREFIKKAAEERSVVGWIRNRADGKVEGVLVGRKKALEQLIERCAGGPKKATVTKIELKEVDAQEHYQGFEIRD